MPDFLNVEHILHELGLGENMLVAEFGCGAAHFTLAIARKVKKGRIYALDIQEEKLSALKSKVAQEKMNNVFTILADLEADNGSTLQSNSLDIVLIPNVLFQAENKHAIINEGARILKRGGELLIIDWAKRTPFNAKEVLVSPDEMKKIAAELNLSLKKEFEAGDYHYGLLFVKP